MAVWIALGFYLVCLVVGVAFAVVRGLGLWRKVKSTTAAFEAETDRIGAAAAEIQGHLDRAEASSARLAEAAERLRASRARLEVQLAAVREARLAASRLLWFMPGR